MENRGDLQMSKKAADEFTKLYLKKHRRIDVIVSVVLAFTCAYSILTGQDKNIWGAILVCAIVMCILIGIRSYYRRSFLKKLYANGRAIGTK